MKTYLDILKAEFSAEENSFLLKLRIDLEWDQQAYRTMVEAMKMYCENHSDETKVDKWLAEGFWYIPSFTRDWSSHPNFPRPYSEEYYRNAYEELDDLAFWFFMGENPKIDIKSG